MTFTLDVLEDNNCTRAYERLAKGGIEFRPNNDCTNFEGFVTGNFFFFLHIPNNDIYKPNNHQSIRLCTLIKFSYIY